MVVCKEVLSYKGQTVVSIDVPEVTVNGLLETPNHANDLEEPDGKVL